MTMWRCPHCGTPQSETARCWVCRRSSTSCGTCRHFRRAIAGELGYCGLDRRRIPLRGDELRGCWEAASADVTAARTGDAGRDRGASPSAVPTGTPRFDFVPVGAVAAPATARPADSDPDAAPYEAAPPHEAVGPARSRAADPLLGFWAEEV